MFESFTRCQIESSESQRIQGFLFGLPASLAYALSIQFSAGSLLDRIKLKKAPEPRFRGLFHLIPVSDFVYLKVCLAVLAHRAHLRGLGSHHDVAADTALPHGLAALLKDLLHLYVVQ